MTMAMTMTRSEKSIQPSFEAWPYRRERRGHDPAKKSLLQLMWLALCGKVRNWDTVDDSVHSHVNQKEKQRIHRLLLIQIQLNSLLAVQRALETLLLLGGPCCPATMTMTMTHSEKSNQQSLEAWPYRRERRGHDPAKKSLLQLMWIALLARFCTCIRLMTVCSTSDLKEKHRSSSVLHHSLRQDWWYANKKKLKHVLRFRLQHGWTQVIKVFSFFFFKKKKRDIVSVNSCREAIANTPSPSPSLP